MYILFKLVTPVTNVTLVTLFTPIILITLITLVTQVTLVTLVNLVTLVTLFQSPNQLNRAECITVSGSFCILRYKSSNLILYKELSSSIFQSLSVSEGVRKASVTPVQISTLFNI